MEKSKMNYYREKREQFIFKILIPVLSIFMFLILWELVVQYRIVPSRYLPKPTELIDVFVYKLSNANPEGATLPINIVSSLSISLAGFVMAIVIGVPLGLVMGWYKGIDLLVKPVFEVIRPDRKSVV